jgi:uncharacterized membrane protein YhiD involved in acid resistance
MAVGGGYYALGGVVLAVTLVVLWFFPWLEHWVDNLRHERTYTVVCATCLDKITHLEAVIQHSGVNIHVRHQVKAGEQMTCRWVTIGTPLAHQQVVDALFKDSDVVEFRF